MIRQGIGILGVMICLFGFVYSIGLQFYPVPDGTSRVFADWVMFSRYWPEYLLATATFFGGASMVGYGFSEHL